MSLPRADVLEKLRCGDCNGYLSGPPVCVKKDGATICWRCTRVYNNSDLVGRNKPYENIASIMSFPCQYIKLGCTEVMKWNDISEHEILCLYRVIKCPLATSHGCQWNSALININKHLQRQHLIHVHKENPLRLSMNVSEDIETVKLWLVGDVPLLLFAKLNVAQQKICFCLSYTIKMPFRLNYDVDIYLGKNMVRKNMNVCHLGDSFLGENRSVEFPIRDLQQLLGMSCGITVEVKITWDSVDNHL